MWTTPASAPPTTGASQNSQELLQGPQPPTNSAVAVLRAGFTDVFVTVTLIR